MTVERRKTLKAGAVCISILATGCSGLLSGDPPIEEMEIDVIDVRSPSLGVSSATLPVVLEFTNSASRSIPDPSAEIDAIINGNTVSNSEVSMNTLEPDETTTRTLDFIIRFSEVSEAVIESLQQDQSTLQLEGQLESEGATRSFTTSLTI